MTPSQQAFVLLLSVVFLSGKENIQNALIRPENKLNNKNVDMKFSAHDAFLEQLSSGTLKVERLGNQMI